MKKQMTKQIMMTAAIILGVMLTPAWPVLGAGGGHDGTGHGNSMHGGTGGGQDMGQGGHMKDQSGHMMDQPGQGMGRQGHHGMKIHSADVDGYHLSYEIIDMGERMKGMQNMPAMAHSHHLMVYITDPGGHPVEDAKVGFFIQGPGRSGQKVMSMGMGMGGYGADADFKDQGTYTIKTKVVEGDKKIMDSFEYKVR